MLSTYRKGQHGVGGTNTGQGGRNDIYFGQYFAYDPASQQDQQQAQERWQPGQQGLEAQGEKALIEIQTCSHSVIQRASQSCETICDDNDFLSRGFVYEGMPVLTHHVDDEKGSPPN